MSAQLAKVEEKTPTCCRVADQATVGAGRTILLVEDEAFVRKVTGEVLESAGYRVLSARNPAEAMLVYEHLEGAVDLLVTDVILPGESGRALAGRLRRRNASIRVLLITGYAESLARAHADEHECLPKPFSSGALLQRVRSLLESGWGNDGAV